MGWTSPSRRTAGLAVHALHPAAHEGTKLEPIYPLRPATRTIKLAIDVETVPEPPDGQLTGFLTREELIEVHLMVPNEEQAPATWTDLF